MPLPNFECVCQCQVDAHSHKKARDCLATKHVCTHVLPMWFSWAVVPASIYRENFKNLTTFSFNDNFYSTYYHFFMGTSDLNRTSHFFVYAYFLYHSFHLCQPLLALLHSQYGPQLHFLWWPRPTLKMVSFLCHDGGTFKYCYIQQFLPFPHLCLWGALEASRSRQNLGSKSWFFITDIRPAVLVFSSDYNTGWLLVVRTIGGTTELL